MRPSWSLVVLALAGSTGCDEHGHGPGDAGVDAFDPHQKVLELPATVNRNLDVLFVIDDSTGMADKQSNLAANFPNFVNVLNTLPGGLPDLHIGVVTTDMGTRGSVGTPGPAIGQIGNGGCSGTGKSGNLITSGAPVTGTFISDIKQTDGSRVKNYTGSIDGVFAMMGRPGAGGCGFEQPLAAMRAALNNNPANAGFLRPDAHLGIVFLTDEDDCSIRDPSLLGPDSATLGSLQSFRCTRFGVTCANGGTTSDEMNQVGTKTGCGGATGSQFVDDVEPFATFLAGLKNDRRNVVVGGIMGPASPYAVELRSPPGGGTPIPALASSCSFMGAASLEVADPAARLQTFLDAFPSRSTSQSICQTNLSDPLVAIGVQLLFAIGTPCISARLADADINTPGLQPDCIVEDIVGSTATPIAACPPTPVPTCWRLMADVATCPSTDHLKLVVERSGAPDPATVTRMRCLLGAP